MSVRSEYDWTPLGMTDDPIPGDVEGIHALAAELRRTRDALDDAQRYLRQLELAGSQGKRIAVLRAHAGGVQARLARVHVRYDVAARALTTYGNQLAGYQHRSVELLEAAGSAARRLQQLNEGEWDDFGRHNATLVDPVSGSDAVQQEQSSAGLHAQVLNARNDLDRLCAQHDADADLAARAIDAASEQSGVDDSVVTQAQAALASAGAWTRDHVVHELTSLGWMSTGATPLAHFAPLTSAVSPVASVGWGLTAATSIGVEFAEAQGTGNWLKFAGVTSWELLITYGHVKSVQALKRAGTAAVYRRRRAELEDHASVASLFREELGDGSGLTRLRRLPEAAWETGMDYQFKMLDALSRRIRPGDHRHVLIPAHVADHAEAEIVKTGIKHMTDALWTAAPGLAVDRIGLAVRAVGRL